MPLSFLHFLSPSHPLILSPLSLSLSQLFAILLAGKPKLDAKYRSEFAADVDKRRQAQVAALMAIVDDINLSHLLHQDAPVAGMDGEM